MKRELEPQFSNALRLRDSGNPEAALAILDDLARQNPSSAAVWLMRGEIQWTLAELESAIESFRRATELAPTMELASLGLFHVLWKSGKEDAAFAEMRRFISLAGPSEEYGRILDGINEGAPNR